MGTALEVTSQTFATEVLTRSHETPVVVDFFATWCGPCQMLKPMLEKLVKEYDVVLAKVDIDQNPDLASAYGVEGVPDVRIASQGQMMPGFVGVVPEPKMRELMAQYNLTSVLEQGLVAVREAQRQGDVAGAKRVLDQLFVQFPEDPQLVLEAARFLISQGKWEEAERFLALIQPQDRELASQAEGLRGLIQLSSALASLTEASELDRQYRSACQAALEGQYTAALEQFLVLVGQDRKYQNDGARKAMITLFNVLGDDHPLTRDYRKRLMQTLY